MSNQKKITLNLELEFYPSENDLWQRDNQDKNDWELMEAFKTEVQNNFDALAPNGLWLELGAIKIETDY